MEEAELNHYLSQLKVEFDSCDTTATGFLDRDELTELCRKLQLDAYLVVDTLLGGGCYNRVNFEEFKEGFVAVLSRSLDFSTSEDDSSYLEPVVPEEVKPKFVKGTKRYGRRSRPDAAALLLPTGDPENPTASRTEAEDSSPTGVRRAKVRRSTSLESVESLKSDEEAGSQKENIQPDFQSKGLQHQKEEELGVVGRGGDQLGLKQLSSEDLGGRVSVRDFQKVLCGSAPFSCSTPIRSADLQRAPPRSQVSEERSLRSTSPSLLTATVGQRVLSRLDEGSGCTSTERVVALWTEEGIRNGRDILQTLDFPLEERLSLADLTLALDNELLVSGNGIEQAALISYKNEIQHLQVLVDQACRERDKVKTDLDQAHQRNLQLVREVDDRHASMETLNQSRIRELEQDFRDRLTALRCRSEQESEALLQQTERERRSLQDQLQLLRVQEAELQEELSSAAQESSRLEEDLSVVKMKLTEAERSVKRLQRDVDQLLLDKFGGLDPAAAGLSHEERFSEIVKDYELQCRELRDRNDELSSEVELLKSQRSDRKSRRSAGDEDALTWNQQRPASSDSDEADMKRSSSPQVRKKLQPADKTALGSLDQVSGLRISIQTELALEQLKQKHNQELQQLHIQLETQVNYYERSLEVMRQSMEVERKDISQAFKMEISELEEQKSQAEQQVKQLKETLEKLSSQTQRAGGGGGGGGGWSHEQERRMQRERAELEQNFAREIGNLVQRLSSEKDQLEAELKLKADQEVMLVRAEAEQQLCHVKLQLADGQRRLLHRLQEQRGFWEERLARSEQEKSSVEEELQRLRTGEERLLLQVTQLKEELGNLQTESDRVPQDRHRLSDAFVQQQERLRAGDQTVKSLQDSTRNRVQGLSKLTAELDSLKTDRARLIQDLKDQAMAVDNLQLKLDGVSEKLDGRNSAEEVLREALEQERTRTTLLRSAVDEDKEEVCRLSQENGSYARLVDQLSNQIIEMEEEISTLRDHLRELSAQLNGTADLVLDLRRQLNSKTCEVDRLRAEVADGADLLRQAEASSEKQHKDLDLTGQQVLQLQQDLQDSRDQLRTAELDFEREKRKMMQQLMELEKLVLDLEEVMDPASPHRTQLEEVRLENGALQQRLGVLQQEVTELEDDVAKNRRRVDEMERDHEKSREEEERLHKENSRHREEVLDLSSRNLKLSNDNAELSAQLRGDQESVWMLRERLETVSKEKEEEETTVRRLQEKEKLQQEKEEKEKLQQEEEEKEKLQQEAVWTKEREKLDRQISCYQEKVEALQRSLLSVEGETELLRSQTQGHAHEVSEQQRKVEELQSSVRKLMKEKEELHRALEELEEQEEQEETHKLRVQNQELQHQLSELQVQSLEVQKLNQEQQNLKFRLSELQTEQTQAQDQAELVQVQRLRRLQEVQRRTGDDHREQEELLRARLEEEQRRSHQLEETLRLQAQQSSSHISMKQDQYEKALSSLQRRMEDLETTLKGVRLVLQEKVQQLKEQLVKNSKTSSLLKDVYVENSELMKALQVTEQRQKHAEKKNLQLEDKVTALNKLLRDVVTATLP
ncbi:ninein-like protein isoform X2 [Cebidichthys violaceus]|uniref:ninein-like protein isoform X2 n=1 Tax=Cebidichthys violaceus TaxID=271503 RepID=UPI0035CAF922